MFLSIEIVLGNKNESQIKLYLTLKTLSIFNSNKLKEKEWLFIIAAINQLQIQMPNEEVVQKVIYDLTILIIVVL